MTMKARIKSSGEIIEVERVTNSTYGRIDGVAELYRKDMLDFNLDPPHPEATISGWVARDQPTDLSKRGRLRLFRHMPHRDCCGTRFVIYGFWDEAISPALRLDENLYPSLTWQDDPLEVEIIIKPKIR